MKACLGRLEGTALDTAGNFWIVGICATLAGALIGYAAALIMNPGTSKSRELESRLQEAQDRLKDYRLEVHGHFQRSADLLRQLTETYREVHNHLAQGAESLCEHPGQPPLIYPLQENLEAQPGQADESLRDIRPPLDYAPKAAPTDKGVLREDFGLDKPHAPHPSAPYHLVDHLDDDEDYTGLSQSKN
jgi:uncharacterized protein